MQLEPASHSYADVGGGRVEFLLWASRCGDKKANDAKPRLRSPSHATAAMPRLMANGQHFDGVESQPLDLSKRDSSPSASTSTNTQQQFLPVFSSTDDYYTAKLTNIVEVHTESNSLLKSSTISQTHSPKSQKGNYFLIDSLLTPAHSSDLPLDSTCKGVERAPVFLGCSLAASFKNPTVTFDIPKRSRIEPEREVARAPAPAVLSPHRTNGQETLNASSSMKKLKREPDETTSATMTPPPNICVDDEMYV
ncbi:hypothetical protein COOONC_00164 [Cooperia oncophora]